MNLAVKIPISGILRDFKPGKPVESPYFNKLGILVRSSTENKIMSQNGSKIKTVTGPFLFSPESQLNSIISGIMNGFFAS